MLSVVQTVIAVNHKIEFGTPKTASGSRTIDLDRNTVSVLQQHRVEQLERRLLLGEGWRDHDLVFDRSDGDPLHPERLSREFDRRVERWGFQRITLHGLRQGWATLALRADVQPKFVQERLGHATIGITLDTYSHVTVGMQREAAEKVAALFG